MFNNAVAASQPGQLEKLWVLYDPSCGFCASCRRWLERQPAWVPLEFVPAGSPEALELFPVLADTREELTVVGNDGSVYRADRGWLVCLWSLQEYRGLAERLSTPALLPYARQAFEVVARNRKEISKTLGLMPEEELRAQLGRIAPTCAKPPLSAFDDEPERGGRPAKIVLGLAVAVLTAILAVTFREPIADWLLERNIVRTAGPLRVLGIHPGEWLASSAQEGRIGRLRGLLRAGVDPSGKGTHAPSPLAAAVSAGRVDTTRALLEAKADPNFGGTSAPPLWEASDTGRLDLVELLLAAHADPNVRNANGDTLLVHLAGNPSKQFEPLVERLIAAGADVNRSGAGGITPLIEVARQWDPEPAKLLLEQHANPSLRDGRGRSALMEAIRNGPAATVEAMLAAGADPNERDREGLTPLMRAASEVDRRDHVAGGTDESARIITLLILAGANPDLTDRRGRTALDMAGRSWGGKPVTWILDAQKKAAEARPSESSTSPQPKQP
jgi:ankyrin repeat protein/predicted DCC family thiol-disulfide oxidoreductase YuxK